MASEYKIKNTLQFEFWARCQPLPAGTLQGLAAFDQYAVSRTHTCANHDCCWRGEPQGAGARNHQHGNAKQQGKEEGVVALHSTGKEKQTACTIYIA